MKKIILAVLSFALLISCFLFDSKNSGIAAGAGLDENQKIESVEELAEFMEFLGGPDGESCTVTLNSTLDTYTRYSSSEQTAQTLNRELTVYLTEDAILYDAKGYINEKRKYKTVIDENKTLVTDENAILFDIQVLCIDDECFVNIRNLSYTHSLNGPSSFLEEAYETRNMQIKSKNTYQWIEMPFDYVEGIINYESFSSVEVLSKMLNCIVETEYVDEDENIISLDERDFLDMAKEFSLPIEFKDADSDLKIDVSSPTIPYMSWTYDYSTEVKLPDDTSVTTSITMSEEMSVKNIDNTEIEFDDDVVSKIVEDDDDFEKLFLIEERRNEDDLD